MPTLRDQRADLSNLYFPAPIAAKDYSRSVFGNRTVNDTKYEQQRPESHAP